MPNWCNNNISISGPSETIRQLWEDAIAEGSGLLNAIAPMPKELEGTTAPSQMSEEEQVALIEKYGAADWYQWCVNNWGTKWDVSLEGLEITDNGDGTASIDGWFDSAWAPPISAYNTFCDDMDNCSLTASYHEPGMDFGGFYDNGDDEYIDDLQSQSKLPEDEQSDLYKRIDEEYGLTEQYEMWEEM